MTSVWSLRDCFYEEVKERDEVERMFYIRNKEIIEKAE